MSIETGSTLLTEIEVARILVVRRSTLQRWRRAGIGPRWLRIGDRLIRYDRGLLLDWIEHGDRRPPCSLQHSERAAHASA